MKLHEALWLWGQDAMSHHRVGPERENIWNIPGENRMGPVEGAAFLGIENCCRVVMNGRPEPPFDAESVRLDHFRKVVWSILGDSGSDRTGNISDDLEEILRQAAFHPNLVGGVLDDFFRPAARPEATDREARLSLARVREIRERLHKFPRKLELWSVIYEAALVDSYRPFLAECDAVSLWTWEAEHLGELEKNLTRMEELCPGRKHLLGCYLYDYGGGRPMPRELMKYQCEQALEYWKSGRIQGMIVCSNCVADVGLEAVAYFREWLEVNRAAENAPADPT